jgi:succinyl-CoA synthetase beta subunit
MHDAAEDDPREAMAAKYSLNYVAMDGEIGCMVCIGVVVRDVRVCLSVT